jgi:uncharacterized phage-associated protein
MMSVDVETCVAYIKKLFSEPMSDAKLNVLLYYASGWNLAITGRPLFEASIFAGPDHPQ